MEMETPEIFTEFCRFFHQDISLIYPSLEALINDFIVLKTDAQLATLKSHLMYLANANITNFMLEEIWSDCGAQVDFPNRSMKDVFREMANYINMDKD